MDFDDLDDVQGLSLEPDLTRHLEETGAPAALADFLLNNQLFTCLAFFEFIKATDEAEIKAELEKRVSLQLYPPCEELKEQVKVRNVWRRCKVAVAEDLKGAEERRKREEEQKAEEERVERERKASEKAAREAEERAAKDRKAAERKEREEQEKLERQKREEARKLERERAAKEAEDERLAKLAAEDERLRHLVAQRKARQVDLVTARCSKELKKQVAAWAYVTVEQVQEKHERVAPGMLYSIDFPWSAEMLKEWGPAWLTKAFHAAGTLLDDNRVTQLKLDLSARITTGNNGGKFIFEVEYAHKDEGLHQKLFAKVPYPMDSKTHSDRLSSSVYKQPQELYELNTYRLLEDSLPVKMPKYYFGDISNETTNWILITEQVQFEDPVPLDFGRPSDHEKAPLEPNKIEGPYDKCIDWTLRGPASDYYYHLIRAGAEIAGFHKAGKLGDPEALSTSFEDFSARPIESWGMHPGCSGEPTKQFTMKLNTADTFIFDAGKVLFPNYVRDETFKPKLRTTLMTLNAYSAESMFWRHRDTDYVALTHNNMNVDNAYWWRDREGKLELGVFDWGNMGSRSLGFKLWWWLYCGDHDMLTEHIDRYLQCFIDTYSEFGGPALVKKELLVQFIITAMEQMHGLCNAVPQIFRMCPRKEWKTISDRWDPRIAENIHGKSTLRLYLHVMDSIFKIIENWKGAEVLQRFVQDFSAQFPFLEKDASAVWGEGGPPEHLLWKTSDPGIPLIGITEAGLKAHEAPEEASAGSAPQPSTGQRRTREEPHLPCEVATPARLAPGVLGFPHPWQRFPRFELLERCKYDAQGHLSCMIFPRNVEQLEEMGAEWLTTAFHKFGTLQGDNRVTKIVEVQELAVDELAVGSCPRTLLSVEYQHQDTSLDTELLVQFPWDPHGRYANLPQRMPGVLRQDDSAFTDKGVAKALSAAFMEHLLPFRVAKVYFADFNRESTNYILIVARAPSGKLLPCRELLLKDPLTAYGCLVRMVAQLAGWDHCGRFDLVLGPKPKFTEQEHLAKLSQRQEKSLSQKEVCSRACHDMVSPALDLAAELGRDRRALDMFREGMMGMAPHFDDVHEFASNSSDFISVLDYSMHIDAVFFDQAGHDGVAMETCAPQDRDCVVKGLLACLISADAKLLQEHGEDLLGVFVKECSRCGGPSIDLSDLVVRYHLLFPEFAVDVCQWIEREVYPEVPNDQRRQAAIRNGEFFGTWSSRRRVTACLNALDLWHQGNHKKLFEDWLSGVGRRYVAPYC